MQDYIATSRRSCLAEDVSERWAVRFAGGVPLDEPAGAGRHARGLRPFANT
jgi:hypothetical protein